MKIVHVIPTLGSGGAERMLSKICEFDKENEHIVITLLTANSHYEIKNANVISLNLENTLKNKLLIGFKLRKLIKKIRPNIIQTWMKTNYYAIFLYKLGSAKLIASYRNGFTSSVNQCFVDLLNIYNKLFDGNIFVSKSALQERLNKGLYFSNSIIINNGFEIPITKNRLNKSTLRIGHLGRHHPVKNQKMIVKAFEIFHKDKDTQLVLGGKELSKLNFKNIDENKFKLLGEINDIDGFYNSIDVFLLTSISEGFPNVVGEAMSYSVPVISTDAGESHRIIDGNGYKISDLDSLVEVLKHIYNNRKELIEKGRLSKKRIKNNFSLDIIIKEYQKYYRNIWRGI